jgi:hypothetical protein
MSQAKICRSKPPEKTTFGCDLFAQSIQPRKPGSPSGSRSQRTQGTGSWRSLGVRLSSLECRIPKNEVTMHGWYDRRRR